MTPRARCEGALGQDAPGGRLEGPRDLVTVEPVPREPSRGGGWREGVAGLVQGLSESDCLLTAAPGVLGDRAGTSGETPGWAEPFLPQLPGRPGAGTAQVNRG